MPAQNHRKETRICLVFSRLSKSVLHAFHCHYQYCKRSLFYSLSILDIAVSGIISFSLDLPIQNREEKPASLFLPVFLGCLRFSDKGFYTRSFRVQCYVNRIVVYFVSASISYLCGNDFSVIK